MLQVMRWTILSLLLAALILVPFVLFEDYFHDLAVRLARGEASTWYAALAIGGLLGADVVLPVPSSLVSAAGGVLLGFWTGTAVVWTGMMVSCLVGYWLGARSVGAARRLVGERGLSRAGAVAGRYGPLAIVLCRPVPVLAEASVILAGLAHAPFRRFLVLCVWSNLGIAMAYAAIGAFSMQVESFLLAFLGAIALSGAAALLARVFAGNRADGTRLPG